MGRKGEIATDQIRTIDKRRLKHKITNLSDSEIMNIQNVLRQMFCE
jgi:mRNA interferase MazF